MEGRTKYYLLPFCKSAAISKVIRLVFKFKYERYVVKNNNHAY